VHFSASSSLHAVVLPQESKGTFLHSSAFSIVAAVVILCRLPPHPIGSTFNIYRFHPTDLKTRHLIFFHGSSWKGGSLLLSPLYVIAFFALSPSSDLPTPFFFGPMAHLLNPTKGRFPTRRGPVLSLIEMMGSFGQCNAPTPLYPGIPFSFLSYSQDHPSVLFPFNRLCFSSLGNP